MARRSFLGALAAVALASAGCVAETDDCRCPPSGPHLFALDDGPLMMGTLRTGDIGPGDRASFSFAAYASGSTTVQGSYAHRDADMLREVSADGWVSYTATSDFDWLLLNRGGFTTSSVTEDWSYIRRFEYHRNTDNSVEYRFDAVPQSRVDYATHTILPGADHVLTVTARLTATCLSLVDGVSQLDPTFANNPLCRDLLAGSP